MTDTLKLCASVGQVHNVSQAVIIPVSVGSVLSIAWYRETVLLEQLSRSFPNMGLRFGSDQLPAGKWPELKRARKQAWLERQLVHKSTFYRTGMQFTQEFAMTTWFDNKRWCWERRIEALMPLCMPVAHG
jgi:hypothetical protein